MSEPARAPHPPDPSDPPDPVAEAAEADRVVIARAEAALAVRHGVTFDEARRVLRAAARDFACPVAVTARDILDLYQAPVGPRPRPSPGPTG